MTVLPHWVLVYITYSSSRMPSLPNRCVAFAYEEACRSAESIRRENHTEIFQGMSGSYEKRNKQP
jgi:hypothetical protein